MAGLEDRQRVHSALLASSFLVCTEGTGTLVDGDWHASCVAGWTASRAALPASALLDGPPARPARGFPPRRLSRLRAATASHARRACPAELRYGGR